MSSIVASLVLRGRVGAAPRRERMERG
jgi:hypothetical protein